MYVRESHWCERRGPNPRGQIRYRPGVEPESVQDPLLLGGDPVLPGFVLALQPVWEPAI